MHKRKHTLREWVFHIRTAWIIFAFFFLFFGAFLSVVLPKTFDMIGRLNGVQHDVKDMEHAIVQFNFSSARTILFHMQENLNEGKDFLRIFELANNLPGIEIRYKAHTRFLESTQQFLMIFDRFLSYAESISSQFHSSTDEQTLAMLSTRDKRLFLGKIMAMYPDAVGSLASLELINISLNSIPSSDLFPFGGIRDTIVEHAAIFQERLKNATPFFEIIPRLFGLDRGKTYLLLFQNNHEVRATGGFIGTYGILTIKNGEIIRLRTDNVYNLDRKAEKYLHILPPKPFLDFFPKKVRYWFLRDANWSPDFQRTAHQAEVLYKLEGGREKLDGVIALTPEVIRSLLPIVGPIEIDGIHYSAESFVKDLQFQVEIGYTEQGIPEQKRKDVIGRLAKEILLRMHKLQLHRLKEISDVLKKNANEKHLLFSFHDDRLQHYVEDKQWDGRMRATDNDYLAVIDSNMASLKTDAVMDKAIEYTVQEYPDGHLQASVLLTYTNRGGFTWHSTRYKDWIRVYVPKGSAILNVQGAMKRELSSEIGPIEISREDDKVIIGAFIVIEPQERRTIRFEYRLPDRIADQVRRGSYELLVQKQSGISNQQITFNLNLLRPLTIRRGNEFFKTQLGEGSLQFAADLIRDREFHVTW